MIKMLRFSIDKPFNLWGYYNFKFLQKFCKFSGPQKVSILFSDLGKMTCDKILKLLRELVVNILKNIF